MAASCPSARVLRGNFVDGAIVVSSRGVEERIGGLARSDGRDFGGTPPAPRKATPSPSPASNISRPTTASPTARARRPPAETPRAPPATQAIAIHVKDRKDEVRLAEALAKLCEEDPALTFVHAAEFSELKLYGQGEMHLRVTVERLADRFGVAVDVHKPTVAYRETIRDTVSVRGRHKKQSGGHGQFGDVLVEVGPRGRGEDLPSPNASTAAPCRDNIFPRSKPGQGFARPRTARFPVVDISVTLIDGSYHTVDSSDMAFRAAANSRSAEALQKARPTLLEPCSR